MLDIDALIFDVDGTLVDSREDIVNCVNFAFNKAGLPSEDAGRIISLVGTGAEDLIKKLLGDRRRFKFREIFNIFTGRYVDHCAERSVLYPNVEAILEYFKDKKKIILTNRMTVLAESTIKRLGIRGYFDDILGADDESCRKPSACPLKRSRAIQGVSPDRAIMIGDMDVDVLTGKESGIKTCWVSYGLGKRHEVEHLDPDIMIDDMIELKTLIR